ncbi:MAG: tetratricopeptide repeat protein [Acidobacteriota bacterium]|nr:tetratricopeptide repeat protein [Acidobacteriota bacterium]
MMSPGIKQLLLALSILWALPAAGQQSADPLAQARSLLAAGKLAESEAVLRGFTQAHPSSAEAHFLLGYVLFRDKKATESLAEFTAGAALQHPHADELRIVASDYVMLGDYGDADKWFTAVVVEKPDDADAWYLLGRTKFNENNFTAAVSCFERVLSLHPRHVEAENNLGLALLQLSHPEKAQAAFQSAIDWQGNAPADAQPFLNLGTLFTSQNNFDKAMPYLTKAAALSPDNPKVHEELAQVYMAQQNLPQAQRELERAVALAPTISGLHFKLGQIYRREALLDRAEQEFALCAQLNSTHSSAATPNPPR